MNHPANILITNYCNQNCTFCFASREMNTSTQLKEMSKEKYTNTLNKLSKTGDDRVIKLLGGEPTLHSKLFGLIDEALIKGQFVQIFTNGVMGKDKIERLSLYGNKVRYTFNVTTPGFQSNKALHTEIIKNIQLLGRMSEITLSMTIDPFFNHSLFFKTTQSILSRTHNIRIGFANPIADGKNWYTFSDFPKMGAILEEFIKTARNKGFKGTFTPNCGFTRCMFTDKQYDFIKSQITLSGWGCFGKTSAMDIAVDMSAFHCFPLSNHKRVDLSKISYKAARIQMMKERLVLWSKYKKDTCLKCPFYGYGGTKCPGPCIAFRSNESNNPFNNCK